MQRKILVTGGAGFIGSNFIRHHLKTYPHDQIINLDALTYAGNLANLSDCEKLPQYHFVHGNITDEKLVNQLCQDIDLIVHFAAESHVDRSIVNPTAFLQTNVLGTLVLLEAAVKNKVGHFHHISTDEVFGSLPLKGEQKFTLNSAYDPHSPYSASKAGSDHLVRAYGDTYGLSYTITNCSNNYGPYQFPEKLFALAITNLLQGKKVPLYGDGLNVRDWLFVQDHVLAIEAVLNAGVKGKTFLVGGLQKDVSNRQVLEIIITQMGKNPAEEITYVTDRPGHDRRYSVDWSQTAQTLSWQPQVSLETGIAQTIAWYKNHQSWWQPLLERAANFKTSSQ